MSVDFQKILDLRKASIDKRLETFFTSGDSQKLNDAVRYSLNAGGKRVRPVLTLAFCGACGGNESEIIDAACAVEMLHTYSLIHDDLPCMDNDDLRRGKPTSHKMFGEHIAVLAGDSLQAEAFSTIANMNVDPKRLNRAVRALGLAAGTMGICAGQTLDMQFEGYSRDGLTVTQQDIYKVYRLKTSVLFEAACLIGVILSGGSAEQERAARIYAHTVGLAFQISDDLLNEYGDSSRLGKATGTDKNRGKVTFASLLSYEECKKMITEQTIAASDAVRGKFKGAEWLMWLANELAGRNF